MRGMDRRGRAKGRKGTDIKVRWTTLIIFKLQDSPKIARSDWKAIGIWRVIDNEFNRAVNL
jgi:hypothetical protein